MTIIATVRKNKHGQHPDHNQRTDRDIIWLDEMVMDPNHPERIPLIKMGKYALYRTMDEGLFPQPVVGRRGWRLGEVREWIRARAAL